MNLILAEPVYDSLQMIKNDWFCQKFYSHAKDLFNLSLVHIDGKRENLSKWRRCLLKDYKDPIPFDILSKCPDTKEFSNVATVFYKPIDPIMCFPIGGHAEIGQEITIRKRKFFNLLDGNLEVINRIPKKDGYYAAFFRWD